MQNIVKHVTDVPHNAFGSDPSPSDNVSKAHFHSRLFSLEQSLKSLLISFSVHHKVCREIPSSIYIKKILLHSNQNLST